MEDRETIKVDKVCWPSSKEGCWGRVRAQPLAGGWRRQLRLARFVGLVGRQVVRGE